MDFFRRQEEARRRTRWLVALYVVALLAVVGAVDLVLLTLVANLGNGMAAPVLPGPAWLAAHPQAVVWTTLLVGGLIGVAGLYRHAQLGGGGGHVAIALGGERVLPQAGDPLHRRLLNVVEEMAIAAGLPVPEVYVLEQEAGINAFAAGFTPADAAIGVTRGALEELDRDALQGVIAHEFSHIQNGDMRLNTRLIGPLFGLTVLALVARQILWHLPRLARRGRTGGVAVLATLAAGLVFALGSVGLLFGRLIQAAVSRHREYLADAAAVQYTRNPAGLRNALVRIGAGLQGSRINQPEAAEVAHLLFAPLRRTAFATHPPLVARIRALDPAFDPAEFGQLRAALDAGRRGVSAQAAAHAGQGPVPGHARLEGLVALGTALQAGGLPTRIGNPLYVHVEAAAALRSSLPAALVEASAERHGAEALLLALCLDEDEDNRRLQLAFIARQLGPAVADRVTALLGDTDALDPAWRLPLLFRLVPVLRRLVRDERRRLMGCLHALLQREGARLSLHAYVLRKLAYGQLLDSAAAGPVGLGRLSLHAVRDELVVLFAVLSAAGHDEASADAAYRAGLGGLLGGEPPPRRMPDHWPARLDQALTRLDRLAPAARAQLVEALGRTVAHDGHLRIGEAELLRAVCAVLHCPMPLFAALPAFSAPEIPRGSSAPPHAPVPATDSRG